MGIHKNFTQLAFSAERKIENMRLTATLYVEISKFNISIFVYSAESNLDFLAAVLRKIQNMGDGFRKYRYNT